MRKGRSSPIGKSAAVRPPSWCPGRVSNPYGVLSPPDFKSGASTSSATRADPPRQATPVPQSRHSPAGSEARKKKRTLPVAASVLRILAGACWPSHSPGPGAVWRRHPDSNRGITVLQTVALDHLAMPPEKWSGKRDSNPRHPPWQGGALPTELFPRRSAIF